jgi:predicted TIM-barrel fold metal-dependent hydrolase
MSDLKADNFLAMVGAQAEVDLRLSAFTPRPTLVTPVHEIKSAKFPAIDYHNHLDAQAPDEVLRVMDACNIERVVNITMRVGAEARVMIDRWRKVAPDRFATIGWMDWSDLGKPDFFKRAVERLERLVGHGACGIKIWKDLGLTLRDCDGELFEKAAELNAPVMFHTADPDAFFMPIDRFNERYEEIAAHPDWVFHGAHYSKDELLAQRDRVFDRHPKTVFVAAHVAEKAENLAYVSALLDKHPNLYIDISARSAELGRQPYTAREFFIRHADRILFGTDLVSEVEMYRLHFRFLETADEYFDYPSHASRQGRWKIYGLRLPDEVLRKVYRENALRLLKP